MRSSPSIASSSKFQSTLPARGATQRGQPRGQFDFISIHAPRTGSDAVTQQIISLLHCISIHAPRTGSDKKSSKNAAGDIVISIHAPRTGSDACPISLTAGHSAFQSTLPARGATINQTISAPLSRAFQSTLPARGATQISALTGIVQKDFNPRSPHGERRDVLATYWETLKISIHAPRTGSDHHAKCKYLDYADFNPRSPHGERPKRVHACSNLWYFNPRSPHGERPCARLLAAALLLISIHAPRTGSDICLVFLS